MRRVIGQLVLLATLPAFSAVCLAANGDDPTLSAEQVLRNVVAAYQSLTSYQDRGVAITRARGAGVPERRFEFETLFTRPGKLRFEWDEGTGDQTRNARSVIWSDGASAWSSFSLAGNRPEQRESLALAVCAATGLSAGVAHAIPKLLTNEINGIRIDELEDYSVTGEESVDGVACVQLTAYYRSGARSTVWVGRDDYLIRRIVTDRGDTEQLETHTDIVVNHEISDSAFRE